MNKSYFGTAGVPINFNNSIYKGKREFFFEWLKTMNLNAYEIQCTYGFEHTGFDDDTLKKALSDGIKLTIHAPYYINLGSLRDEVQNSSVNSLIEGIALAKKLGVERIIFHPGGGYGKGEDARRVGIEQIIKHLNYISKTVDMGNVKFYPEIGGKESSLGSLDEILEICSRTNCCMPCIDIAHLHAREHGSLNNIEDFVKVFQKIESTLGRSVLDNTHFHSYTIAYTEKGEKHHLKFGEITEQSGDGVEFLRNFIEATKIMKMDIYVISEASDTQDLGADFLRNEYYK